jgi:hypothetical protein
MARIRREHHEPDLAIREEVDGEMFVPAPLPLSPERRRRGHGDRRVAKVGYVLKIEEHLPQRLWGMLPPLLPFLLGCFEQELQPAG